MRDDPSATPGWRAAARSHGRGHVPYLLTLLDYGHPPAHGWGIGSRPTSSTCRRGRSSTAIWVPDGSLGIEGFVFAGTDVHVLPAVPRTGATPRAVHLTGVDGRLTLLSMALALVLIGDDHPPGVAGPRPVYPATPVVASRRLARRSFIASSPAARP